MSLFVVGYLRYVREYGTGVGGFEPPGTNFRDLCEPPGTNFRDLCTEKYSLGNVHEMSVIVYTLVAVGW